MAVPGTQNTINGTNSSNFLKGTTWDDSIYGRDGWDLLWGGPGVGADYLVGGKGTDLLVGGKGNDWLLGGEGNDILFGGAGADQFRFDGNDVSGKDSDLVADLNFAQGDKLVLYGFAAGTLDDKDGILETGVGNDLDITVPYPVDPARYGEGAVIDSYADLAELVKYSDHVQASRLWCTNTLVLSITDGDGDVQQIQLANAYKGFADAGGMLGI